MKDSPFDIDIEALMEWETESAALGASLPCCEEKGKTLPEGFILEDSFMLVRTIKGRPFGAVYLAKNLAANGELCVIKEVCGSYTETDGFQEAAIRLKREADILKSLNHPQVSHFVAYFTCGKCSFLVLDYIEGVTLAELMDGHPDFFTEAQVIKWTREISNIFRYMHGQMPKPLLYNNLRPENIVLCKASNTAMLIDFKLAGYSDDPLSLQQDVSALACLMFELITRRKVEFDPGSDKASEIRALTKINPTVSEKWRT